MNKFRRNILNPLKFKAFLMTSLPMGWLSGMKVTEFTDDKATVLIRHKFLNKNPFKSMFWAVQGMAAEMSTGVQVLDRLEKSPHKISMLVLNMDASFSKKAVGKIRFTCEDGGKLDDIFEKVNNSDDGHTAELTSVGIDDDGDEVSRFTFTWTLKKKSKS